jgi:RNA polymerase sigma factor (sigma-70 family)
MSPSVSIGLLSTQSDARLLELAQAGHERAFETLVRRYRRSLLAYCRRLLLSEERAEDALQQALLQAWLSLRSGVEVTNLRPWLQSIVHNTAMNALRVSGYDYCKLSESLSGADAPHADLDRRIAVREALAGLAALPQMQREAMLRTAVEGDSHQQVARDLGLSENALRGLVYRARTTLRAAVGALMPPPVLSWALSSGARGTTLAESVGGLGLGGGSASVAGLLMKGGAVAVTAGVLAGGVHVAQSHRTVTVERSSPPHVQLARPRQRDVSAATVAQAPETILSATTRRLDRPERSRLERAPRHGQAHRRHREASENLFPAIAPPRAGTGDGGAAEQSHISGQGRGDSEHGGGQGHRDAGPKGDVGAGRGGPGHALADESTSGQNRKGDDGGRDSGQPTSDGKPVVSPAAIGEPSQGLSSGAPGTGDKGSGGSSATNPASTDGTSGGGGPGDGNDSEESSRAGKG